ncbi:MULTISPECIES: DUF354 domain-containing protein [Natrialbaceae]|uniref:DUF354 domain-containing protein n=1 Tax=Natrialbaceae TaxID=1644061 RepID=UPI00207C4977|nr:DUF354 domain-containing protein [Natronococcus sp. CG52]
MSNTELKQGEEAQRGEHNGLGENRVSDPSTIIFTIQHPAHVHLFRNSIRTLSEQGHEVHTLAREKEINIDLLDQYGIDYELLADEPKRSWELPLVQLKYEYGIIRKAREVDPDVLVAMGEPSITHAAKLTDSTSLVFTDTEHATLQNTLAFPFADRIYTPECYQDEIGEKQVRYPGYHELAYLHPDRFEPDPSILEEAGLERDEQFVVLRLVSWDAMHDVGDSGFEDITDVVHALEDTGTTVCITSEAELPDTIEDRRASISPDRIHDLMAFSDLYVGESATMATESAVLGTPAVFVSSSRRGYTDELEDEYGLVFNYSGENRHEQGLEQALEILETDDTEQWNQRHAAMLEDKVDVTEFIMETVRENVQ